MQNEEPTTITGKDLQPGDIVESMTDGYKYRVTGGRALRLQYDDVSEADGIGLPYEGEKFRLIYKGNPLSVGGKVQKVGGDYRFDGVIVAAFKKTSGQERFVVEDSRGLLFIFNRSNLEVMP